MEALDELILRLEGPLTKDDEKRGWTEEKRRHWLVYFDGLREGIRVATDYEHSLAPFHLVRWLDHDGLIAGKDPIAHLVAETQGELSRPYGREPSD